ncbi:MAG: hypothetical protein WC695_07560 [Candidatus Omnitrophota bacterium]
MAIFKKGCFAFLILYLAAGPGPLAAQDEGEFLTPNIVILTIMGANRADTIDDPQHQYMPHLFNEMAARGVLYTHCVDANVQFHIPSTQSINTGFSYGIFEPSKEPPSFFQYARKKFRWPATKAWVIGDTSVKDPAKVRNNDFGADTLPCYLPKHFNLSKEGESILAWEDKIFLKHYARIKANPLSLKIQWDSTSLVRYRLFQKIRRAFKPKLVHYALEEVECAHFTTWANYVLALKHTDEIIFNIWQDIQSDPYYAKRTYLIVTVDHLRNRYYMQHHENSFDNPSLVWLYIYGPDIKKGERIDRTISHADIFATVAYLYDLQTHPCDGKSLRDAFSGGKEQEHIREAP